MLSKTNTSKSSRHDRDDRRDRDRDRERGDRRDRDRDRDRDRERRRSRSPHHRPRREYEDSYSSSRDYRAREREDRHAGRRNERDWDRHHEPRRRDDGRQPRRDRDLFDDRRAGGAPRDREQERGMREDRDEFAAQARGAKTNSPPPKKREPTPDLTDVTPILQRKRRLTQWDIKPPGYESVTAEQAKLSGMFPLPGAPRQPTDASKLQALINQPTNIDKSALKPSTSRQSRRLFLYNIPSRATEESVIGWFNLHLNGLNVVKSSDPCVQVHIADDRSFALVEFKTAEDATVALSLDGEAMEEHVAAANGNGSGSVQGLEIKRPKDYIVPTPDPEAYNNYGKGGMSTEVPESENKICVSNLPTFLNEEQAMELFESFGKLKAFVMVKDHGMGESRVRSYQLHAQVYANVHREYASLNTTTRIPQQLRLKV